MPVTGQKVEVWRGDTRIIAVSITGPDGTPFDMAGCSARWWVARSFKSYDDEVIIRKDSDDGSIIITGNGVEIALTTGDTDIAANNYYHELKIFGGTDVSTAMTGEFIVHDALDMTPPYDTAPPPVRLVNGGYSLPIKPAARQDSLSGPRLRPVRTIGY